MNGRLKELKDAKQILGSLLISFEPSYDDWFMDYTRKERRYMRKSRKTIRKVIKMLDKEILKEMVK